MGGIIDGKVGRKIANMDRIPVFRTPEEVAPELGMTKTELRRYCRESGHYTRLSKNRIMLHQSDIENLVRWVRERKPEPRTTKWEDASEDGIDHFA